MTSIEAIVEMTKQAINLGQGSIENALLCWVKWKDLAREWGSEYIGESVRLVESTANSFFVPPWSKSDIGRYGKLCAASFVFYQNFTAWHYGFSGLMVYVDFGDESITRALIEEIEFL